MLKREDFTPERIEQWAAEAAKHGFRHFLSHEQRAESLRAALADLTPGEDVWVFAYGSLMWNPAFHSVERRAARLEGWRRSFCFWTPLGRGTPDRPGLMLALERGGACEGVAWRIAAPEARTELGVIWNREMLSGVYRAEWVDLVDRAGTALRALTFAVNPDHPQYVGGLSVESTAGHIAFAQGRNGRCCDYLFETAALLDDIGARDPYIDALTAEVRRRQGTPAADPPEGLEEA